MIKLAKGWTKRKVMNRIKKYNNNTCAFSKKLDSCVYETSSGNRCAIGCFIPDGHPGLQVWENVIGLLEEYPDLKKFMPFDDIETLIDFQNTHDDYYRFAKKSGPVYERIKAWLDKNVKE